MSDRVENNGNVHRLGQSEPSDREVLHLFAALCDDSLSDQESARLADLLECNSSVQQRYIEFMHLDTQLRYELADESASTEIASQARSSSGAGVDLSKSPACGIPTAPSPAPLRLPADGSGGLLDSLFQSAGNWLPTVCRSTAFGMLACAVLGASVATWIVVQMARRGAFAANPPRATIAVADQHTSIEPESYVATLVNATNCRWDKSRSTIDFQNRGLKPGQSLHLLEGVAEINSRFPSGAVADFQLEGPLALVMTSEGMPSLHFGRLTGSFRSDYERFTLDTPLGRVVVSGDASIGIVAAANDVELHVFSGTGILESPSTGVDPFPDQLKVISGNSLRARLSADGTMTVEHGQARENRFATTTNPADSQLAISRQYVEAIRRAKPLGYWRFESDGGGLIRNEMSDWLHCRVIGDAIRLHSVGENRTAEFGTTAGPGYLLSDDAVADIGESYSIEAWIKPAYYHHAVVFSLLDPPGGHYERHHVHLELCGPGPGQAVARSWENHPGRIRFLHRGNSQCFSTASYALRKWQHVAAVNDRADMHLYVDGQRVATAEKQRPLGNNLHVLMGQLYFFPKNEQGEDEMASRLFVGELDEVALYDRALNENEIKEHYRMAKPNPKRLSPDI